MIQIHTTIDIPIFKEYHGTKLKLCFIICLLKTCKQVNQHLFGTKQKYNYLFPECTLNTKGTFWGNIAILVTAFSLYSLVAFINSGIWWGGILMFWQLYIGWSDVLIGSMNCNNLRNGSYLSDLAWGSNKHQLSQ